MKDKIDDCPLAPVGNYQQGYPNEEGHPVRTVLYVPPCKDWDGEICHWFDPPQRVEDIVNWIKVHREEKDEYCKTNKTRDLLA